MRLYPDFNNHAFGNCVNLSCKKVTPHLPPPPPPQVPKCPYAYVQRYSWRAVARIVMLISDKCFFFSVSIGVRLYPDFNNHAFGNCVNLSCKKVAPHLPPPPPSPKVPVRLCTEVFMAGGSENRYVDIR